MSDGGVGGGTIHDERTSIGVVDEVTKCSFCQSTPAVVVLVGGLTTSGKSLGGKKKPGGKPPEGGRPLCLLHYYTTRAVRSHQVHRVRLLDGEGGGGDDDRRRGDEFRRQMDEVQSIFAEAYGDVRREVAEASALALDPTTTGTTGEGAGVGVGPRYPRAGGSKGAGRKRGTTRPVDDDPEEKELSRGGGFVRDLRLPERYVRHQEKLAAEASATSGSSAGGRPAGGRGRGGATPRPVGGRSTAAPTPGGGLGDGSVPGPGPGKSADAPPFSTVQANPYKRRKNTKVSYWDVTGGGGADDGTTGDKNKKKKKKKTTWEDIEREHASVLASSPTCASCGSTDVRSEGNVTGRNNDMAKGETWGNKDRADVVMRWRCQSCGSAWHEEG